MEVTVTSRKLFHFVTSMEGFLLGFHGRRAWKCPPTEAKWDQGDPVGCLWMISR